MRPTNIFQQIETASIAITFARVYTQREIIPKIFLLFYNYILLLIYIVDRYSQKIDELSDESHESDHDGWGLTIRDWNCGFWQWMNIKCWHNWIIYVDNLCNCHEMICASFHIFLTVWPCAPTLDPYLQTPMIGLL